MKKYCGLKKDTKLCPKCKRTLLLQDFNLRSRGDKTEPISYCKECYNEYSRKSYNRRVKGNTILIRKYKLNKYGLTHETYTELYTKQQGKCAVCNSEVSFTSMNIDHCHTTGKVRGLLCMQCNVGLGNFRDSTKLLTNAINYLNEKDYNYGLDTSNIAIVERRC